jgi:arginyl-tRNA synthetase
VDTKFDRLFFESECYESGKVYAEEGLKKGILQKSEGAIIFPGSEYGLHDRVFITSEGTPTYEAKDLGLVKLQLKEFNPDLIMHVLGPEQLGYTSVIFKAQELLFPETKGKQLHVPYGWVRLKEGKMSSRTGKVVLGESLLDDAKNEILKSYKIDDKTAEEIAVGAVKYSFLKVGREQDIAYDLKESISLEGNSGPYIQYTFARCQSVLAKAKEDKNQSVKDIESLKLEPEEFSVLQKFIHFPEVIEEAAEKYSPNLLCNYLYDLAKKYNTFYNAKRVLGLDNRDLEKFRLSLTKTTGQILKTGLKLLGIEAPEKM